MEANKPLQIRDQLHQQGKLILRAMEFNTYGKLYIIKQYNGSGWEDWPDSGYYLSEEDAYSQIKRLCKINHVYFVDDKKLEA